jgi:hypothetical protein
MKLSDEKLIEFLWKSPVKSFAAMLDALRYLDGKWMQEEAEYELFDEAMGDNATETVKVRVPQIRGIAANALLAFGHHAQTFNLIRRRPRAVTARPGEPEEMIVFYEMTPSGSYVVKVLEVLTDVTERVSQDYV